MNPQHTIPTVKEGDFVVTDSKAAAAYVAGKYDGSGRLYPRDPEVRGRVDQRVYFHEGTFYPRAAGVMVSCEGYSDTPSLAHMGQTGMISKFWIL